MKSIRINRIKNIFCIVLALLLMNTMVVRAADDVLERTQIIFVLDSSHSMSQDRWQETVDSMAMIAAMLPAEYEISALVFNQDIVMCTEFGQPIKEQLELLRGISPAGYTNTGLALQTALGRFDKDVTVEKRIILVSDGEISMKKQQETEGAVVLYDEAVECARRENVIVDMFLFEPDGFEEQVAQGAEATGGCIFRRTEKETVEHIGEKYLFECLGMSRIVVGSSDALAGENNIFLQDTLAEKVWILMTSESDIKDIRVSCQSKEILTTRGNKFVVIELDEPLEDTVHLQYTLAEQGKTEFYISKEYVLNVSMEVCPISEGVDSRIEVSIRNAGGKSLLANTGMREKINIYLDNDQIEYSIDHDNAVLTFPVNLSREVEVRVDIGQLEGRIICDDLIDRLWIEKPYQEIVEERESYTFVYAVITGICLLFILLLLILARTKKKTTISQSIGETPKFNFSGQLVVYMLKNPLGEDMPPSRVNLYLRESSEPFNFVWVSEKCHMDMQLKNADKIWFQGGAEHTLCVKNKGDVTVVFGKEILQYNKKCILHYDEKLLLIFNDGETELEIHYKNMKPSEREG